MCGTAVPKTWPLRAAPSVVCGRPRCVCPAHRQLGPPRRCERSRRRMETVRLQRRSESSGTARRSASPCCGRRWPSCATPEPDPQRPWVALAAHEGAPGRRGARRLALPEIIDPQSRVDRQRSGDADGDDREADLRVDHAPDGRNSSYEAACGPRWETRRQEHLLGHQAQVVWQLHEPRRGGRLLNLP